MIRRVRAIFSLFVVIGCVLSASLPVLAQEEGTPAPTESVVILGLFPEGGLDGDRFEFTLEPGESAELTVVMVSFGEDPVRLRSYASHIIPVPNGGMQIPDFGAEPEGTVSWLDFPTDEEFVLQPAEPVEKTLRVTVPEGTPPGQYVNAIALETLDPVTTEGSPFEQYFRKVVSVYVTVPGDVVVDFELGTPEVLVSSGQAGIEFPLVNTGNTRIDLQGTLTLTDESGAVIYEGNAIFGPVYNGQETVWQIPMSAVPPAGEGYSISYSLVDRNTETTKSSDSVAVTVPEDANAAADAPVNFANVAVEANADPIVFANVSVDVVIQQSAHRSTRLTLSVFHNGEFVEDFVLADNLALPLGSTTVTQRYLPATDWEPGTYTFSLKLEATGSDQQSLLFEQEDVATIEVP